MVVKEKAKYKETEIGIIPEDWEVESLGTLARIYRGASPRPIDSPIWFDENSNVGWVRISDVSKSSKYLFATTQKLSEAGIKNSRFIDENNLIMSICATVGRPIITQMKVCIHDGFVVFENSKIDKEYLYYYLMFIEDEWFKYGQIGSQMNLNTTIIQNQQICYPTLSTEQTSVIEALNDIDQLINSLERIIIKKLNIKQGAIKELLSGKKRLPGFAKSNKFKQTEIGIIPEDWDLKQIGDVCQIFGRIGFRGYTVNDIVRSTEGAVTISPSNIQDGKMDFAKCTYISWFKYEESPEIKIFNGDILLVKTGSTFGKTAIVSGLKEKATVNPQIVVLKKITIDNYFLGYLIGFEVVQNQIKTSIVGGAIPTLSQKQVASFLIPLPHTKGEQTAIAQVLSDMDLEINALETKLAKYQKIKQGMMETLLTGRIRLV
jgi:type I restriction enzyme S subunit